MRTSSQRVTRGIAAGVVLLLAGIAPAAADYIEPSKVKVQTEQYTPESKDFAAGTYTYQVAWQGIPVAEAKVKVEDRFRNQAPFWQVRADAKTGSFVAMFYKLRFSSESLFSADSLRPIRFYSDQKVNSESRRREISFADDGVIRAKYVRDGEPKDTIEFQSDNLTLDPISAAFVARSVPLELGAKRTFDVFNGKHRYLITFTVDAREDLELNGRVHDTYKIVPTVQKLTDTEGEQRLKHATLWVTADESREVLKLESSVLIGKVSAKLVKFEPKTSALAFARGRKGTLSR